MPLLTVMMPAFNAETHIGMAISTTLRSMPRDSELVVLDDASGDATAELVAQVGDARVRLIRSDKNVGGGAARIRLFEQSDSRYVASMDADDVCLPWRFPLQLGAVGSADVVFGAAVRFGRGVTRLRPSSVIPISATEAPSALMFHNPFFHPTMLARRDVIQAVGGYRPLRIAQDYELWLRISAGGYRLRRIAAPVIGYRESEGQVTRESDYLERVRHNGDLRAAYVQNFRANGRSEFHEDVSRADVEPWLTPELPKLRSINRLRYRRLATSRDLPVPLL